MTKRPTPAAGFQGQDVHETFRLYFRQHWIRMLWPTVRSLLLTALLGGIAAVAFLVTGIDSSGMRLITALFLAVCLLAVQLWFLARFYRYFLHVVVITDRRAHRIKKTLLAYDEHESVDLWTLQEIRKLQRGPVQNTLGFGTLHLISADMQLRLHFVPHVSRRATDLLGFVEEGRTSRAAPPRDEPPQPRTTSGYTAAMQILPADSAGIAAALDVLRKGGVVAHATETCYGLACDLTNPEAVAKVFAIKRRPGVQPVSALFASVEAAKAFVAWNPRAEELAAAHLPGPLTLILPLRTDAPARIFPTPAGGTTVGVRVSPHPVARALAEGFSTPLSTTSANVHGQPNPYSTEDIGAQFAEGPRPELVLDSGTLPPTPPSTVMDLSSGAGTLRTGALRI